MVGEFSYHKEKFHQMKNSHAIKILSFCTFTMVSISLYFILVARSQVPFLYIFVQQFRFILKSRFFISLFNSSDSGIHIIISD